MNPSAILSSCGGKVWSIEESALRSLCDQLEAYLGGNLQPRAGNGYIPPTQPTSGTVAVLPLYGVLVHRPSWFSAMFGTSCQEFLLRFRQAVNNPAVKAIVIDVDSPGGAVFGVEELAVGIYEARGRKPIVAIANAVMASAAYWAASAADEIVVAPGGQAGSIGVMAVHSDLSGAAEKAGIKHTIISAGRYKAEGSELAPMSDEARAAAQKMIDNYYDLFVNAVARNRRTTPAAVRGGFGQGRVLVDRESVKAGLADRVGTLGEAISRIAAGKLNSRNISGAAAESYSVEIERGKFEIGIM